MVLSVRNWDWLAFHLEAEVEVVDVEWVVKGALVDEDQQQHYEYAYY